MGKSTINGPFSDNSYVELPEGTSQVLVVSQLPKIKRCSDLHPKITKLDRNVIFQTHESGVLCWIKGVCNLRQPNLAMNKKTTDDVPIIIWQFIRDEKKQGQSGISHYTSHFFWNTIFQPFSHMLFHQTCLDDSIRDFPMEFSPPFLLGIFPRTLRSGGWVHSSGGMEIKDKAGREAMAKEPWLKSLGLWWVYD